MRSASSGRRIAQANNATIDASTVLPNGVAINGPVDLRKQLASHPDAFVTPLPRSC